MEIKYKIFDSSSNIDDQRFLFRDSFPETIGKAEETKEYYFWKFHEYPEKNISCEYAAFEENQIIGYYAAIPLKYKIINDYYTAGMVCDVMTNAKVRGKGIFTKLGRFSIDRMNEQKIDFCITYPIRPQVMPGFLKTGFTVIKKLPIYIKVLKTNSLLKNKKIGFLYPIGNIAAKLYKLMFPKLDFVKYKLTIYKVNEFLEIDDYELFLDKWMNNNNIVLCKTMDFIKWRLGSPFSEYRIFVIRNSIEIVGLSICRETILENIPTLAIIDIMILKEHYDGFKILDEAMEEYSYLTKTEIIATMIGKDWARNYGLVRTGYIKSPYRFSLIINQINPNLSKNIINEKSNWQNMWIDSDDL